MLSPSLFLRRGDLRQDQVARKDGELSLVVLGRRFEQADLGFVEAHLDDVVADVLGVGVHALSLV